MSQDNYYVPMTDEAFKDIQEKAIELWSRYDDTHGYASEKINKVKSLENIGDNGLFVVAMFDDDNISTLFHMLDEDTKQQLMDKRIQTVFSVY